MVKVWKPSAHVPAVHVVEAIPVVETLPVQAVHDPSTTPVTSSMVAAHEVQTRFVVGVQPLLIRIQFQNKYHIQNIQHRIHQIHICI